MERGRRSGESSGVLVKIRNSSGCMILKKKSEASDRIGPSKCKKKSSKIVTRDSESSDEILTPPRGSTDPETVLVCDVLTGLREGSSDKSGYCRKRNRAEIAGFDEDGFVGASSFKEPIERKKSRLNVFESDGFDGRMMKRKRFEGNGRNSLECTSVSGSNRGNFVERSKRFYVNGTGRANLQEENESDSDFEKPIRVQGKNGVLKVMKKKKMDVSFKNFDHLKVNQNKNGLNKNIRIRSMSYLDSEGLEKPWVSLKAGTDGKNSNKILVNKRLRIREERDSDSGSEDSEMLMKLDEKKVESLKIAKRGNSKRGKSLPEPLRPVVKCGSGTEKQRLREKIRKMLLDAGWTIDYRPRKNREYMDAVYVNPAGTAYWSIIKAYEAFLKQKNKEPGPSNDDPAFASISVEILNKLTRKTRNKIEKGARERLKGVGDAYGDCGRDLLPKTFLDEKSEEGSEESDMQEEMLSSFVKQGGKLSKKMYRESVPGLKSNSASSLYHEHERASCRSNTDNVHENESSKFGRCTLLVRSSNEAKNSENDAFIPYSGKRTVLSWLIDSGTAQLSQKVKYMNGRHVMLEGWITREGIHCGCCSKILTVTKFELHAGSKLHQPLQNVYLDSGVSLLQCQMDAWNKQKDAMRIGFHNVDTDGYDPHDDTCSLCGDVGDLIRCDGCPSTFHQSCLDIQTLAIGGWRCPNCTCRNCGDAIMDTTTLAEGESVPSFLFCRMCGRKYHRSCTKESSPLQADSIGSGASFCRQTCLKLFEDLHKFLGVKNEIEAGFSWSLIHREHQDSDPSSQALVQRVENNSKLAVALNIMDECFSPLIDRRSGINLIHNVLYNCGSNFNRLNYSGFYTAILERGDEIISAASIRFHGARLVEMPFIGTRHVYRRQGMCRRLFNAIESAMKTLKIEKMVIPAVPCFMNALIQNFGFSPLRDPLKKVTRSLNLLVFPGIDMLQKQLLGQEDARVTIASGKLDTKMDEKPGIDSSGLDEKTVGNVSEPRVELSEPSECLSMRSVVHSATKWQNISSVSPANVKNCEADANSYSQETVAADASCDYKLCNETNESVSDMNLRTHGAPDPSENASAVPSGLRILRSCQGFNVRDSDDGTIDTAVEFLDEKLVSAEKSASDELVLQREYETDQMPACNEEPFCNEKVAFREKSVPDVKPAETDKLSYIEKPVCVENSGLDENPTPDEEKSAFKEKFLTI